MHTCFDIILVLCLISLQQVTGNEGSILPQLFVFFIKNFMETQLLQHSYYLTSWDHFCSFKKKTG